MKKKILSAIVSVTLVFAMITGTLTPQIANPIKSDAAGGVYDFDFGPGITWGKDDELPTFAPITADKDNMMEGFVANSIMQKSPNTQFSNYSNEVKYAMVSLQGIVNRTRPQIILMSDAQEGIYTWPNELVGSDKYHKTTDYIYMVNKYKSYINGMIVYNPNVEATINVATSIAGVKDCLVVNSALAAELSSKCGLKTVLNFNNISSISDDISAYNYLYENYYKTGLLNKRLIMGLNPTGHVSYNRDLAVATKSALLWLEPNNAAQREVLDKFYKEATVGVTYNLGWWPAEDTGICYATKMGVSTVPSDCFENMTVYMAGSKEFDIPAVPAKPKLENKIYVALTFSDGDNTQYNEHVMRIRWGSTLRTKYPITWTVSPALYYCAPQMLNYYYKTAENSSLVSGPSGMGYTKTTRWRYKEGFLDKFAAATDKVFEKTGINITTMWDRISEECYSDFAFKMKSLLGVTINNNDFNDKDNNWPDAMYNRGYKHWPENGNIAYKNERPILGLGWPVGYCTNSGDIANYLDDIGAKFTGDAPVFRVAQFVPWDVQTPELRSIAENLEKKYPGKFEFVRADHLFMLANEYNKVPYNLALQKKATASYSDSGFDPKNAVDGSFTTGWSASYGADNWYQVDLGARCNIKRYVLKNAETGYHGAENNTKSYTFEYSLDGVNWTKAGDPVKNNTDAIIYKDAIAQDVRYVRVKITDPGADGVARIQDLEVYGTVADSAGKDELLKSYDECKNLTQGSRSDYVWNNFKQALDNALKVINNQNSTASQLEQAYSELLAARKALIYDTPATDITVPSELILKSGEVYTVNAALQPSNTTDSIVAWSSADSSVADVANGVITAKKLGDTVVTVKTNRGFEKQISIKVRNNISGLNLDKTAITLKNGTSAQLNAQITPSDAFNIKVNWSSSNDDVVSVSEGKLYAKSVGSAVITAASDGDSKLYKTCRVTVLPPVSKITLGKKRVTVKKGKKTTVKATVTPANAFDKAVIWSTSNKKIAKVNGGKITGVFGGTAVITAKAGGKIAKLKVFVNGLSKGNKAYFKSGKKIKNKWVKVSKKWYYANKKGKITKITKKR